MNRLPPGPKSPYPGSGFLRFRKDPLGFLENVAREFGDIASWKIGGQRVVLVNHPNFIRDVLVTQGHKFVSGFERSKKLLGEGLLTSEGEIHRRNRRMMQPAFAHERIATFGGLITNEAAQARHRWSDGTTLNISDEMTRLALAIVGQAIFGTDLAAQAGEIRAAFAATMGSPPNMILPFGPIIEKLPLPGIRKMKAGRAKLGEIARRLMNERRGREKEGDDLLSILLLAQAGDAEITNEYVRDELITTLIAGHDTTAGVLSWTWHLLARNPEVETRLHQELDRVLGKRSPAFGDLPALAYTDKVIRESMRIHPPVWLMWRRALTNHQINGYFAPAGSIVAMSQHLMHRDARYFSEPLQFNPDRWTPEFKSALPKYAYFPFGGGPRQCLGEGLAWLETILIVATLAQQWKFRIAPGSSAEPDLRLTQRAPGLKMIAVRR